MTTTFPQANCLVHLEQIRATEDAGVPTWLAQALPSGSTSTSPSKIIDGLIQLLTARKAVWQAARDTALIADELRRYQKFAKPGQPSAPIVQLRQKQAAARQASSIARQSFIRAAAAFVREAHIDVPQRVALEAFVTAWIENKVPKSTTPAG